MNKNDVYGIICAIAVIGWIFVFFFGMWVMMETNHNYELIHDYMNCKELSEYFEDEHNDITQKHLLENCVIGERP